MSVNIEKFVEKKLDEAFELIKLMIIIKAMGGVHVNRKNTK